MIYISTFKGVEDENNVMKNLQKQNKPVTIHEIKIRNWYKV